MILEPVEETSVDVFFINESESIVVEHSSDYFILENEDCIINLNETFDIKGLSVTQDNNKVLLENESQVDYFKSVIENFKKG